MTDEEANKILDIEVVTFDYKDKYGEKNQRGCIAEQVVEHIPSVVLDGYDIYGNHHDINSIDYSKFTPYLLKKTQMQETVINNLLDRVARLENT